MKRQILLMGIALVFTATTSVQAEIPLKPNTTAPKYSQRIQPAAATYYDYYYGPEPISYYKYDAWGNQTEYLYNDVFSIPIFQTWDNSKGYPILLDVYSKIEEEIIYSRRTTFDASGIRIALDLGYGNNIPLDDAGHVTGYSYDDHNKVTESNSMTWNGDCLTTFKYDYVYTGEEETHFDLKNIEIAHQIKPFNAYEYKYYETLTEPLKSGVWINADGTGTKMDSYDTFSGALQIKSEVSSDKKTLIKTETIDGIVMRSDKMVITDDNGSFTFEIGNEYGMLTEWIYIYNDYGDVIQIANSFDLANADIDTYKWEYDADGRPLKVERYRTYGPDDTDFRLLEAYTFTAWHDGSSINSLDAGSPRILGATLYTTDGTKVRTLTPEEAQSIETLTAPQRGVYLLRVQTDKGTETCKVVL